MLDNDVQTLAIELGDDTIKYLGDLASESYKRQAELDESVWRSLPFFAATFAFVATIIGRSASDVPAFAWAWYPAVPTALLALSVGSLAWALRWFWVVLKPREYEYPAPDADIRQYAQGTAEFHAASGLSIARSDAATLRDMRLFMIDQYGAAAATNLSHNAVKLKARPKVLLFMLLGFVLAFACEATIFVHTHLAAAKLAQGNKPDDTSSTPDRANTAAPEQPPAASAGAAKVAVGERRGGILGRKLASGDQDEAMTRGRNPVPPAKPTSSPQRPAAPPLQTIAKDHALNEGTRTNPSTNNDRKK